MANDKYSKIPQFKYHPSPFSSGAIKDSKSACECCGEAHGLNYEGPVYCADEVECVCPWCIADGSAHEKWDAEFTDAIFLDEFGDSIELEPRVLDEVLHRTPGVVGACQSISWWVHCGEPAQFLRMEDEYVRFRCGTCGKTHSYHDLD